MLLLKQIILFVRTVKLNTPVQTTLVVCSCPWTPSGLRTPCATLVFISNNDGKKWSYCNIWLSPLGQSQGTLNTPAREDLVCGFRAMSDQSQDLCNTDGCTAVSGAKDVQVLSFLRALICWVKPQACLFRGHSPCLCIPCGPAWLSSAGLLSPGPENTQICLSFSAEWRISFWLFSRMEDISALCVCMKLINIY